MKEWILDMSVSFRLGSNYMDQSSYDLSDSTSYPPIVRITPLGP
jgi:hypothetical protein